MKIEVKFLSFMGQSKSRSLKIAILCPRDPCVAFLFKFSAEIEPFSAKN